MNRRRALAAVGALTALTAWTTTSAHAADPQWKRGPGGDLLLHADGQDPGSGEVAEILAKQLRKVLPDSGARVVREPTAERLDSVMATARGDVAVIAYDIALEMYRGEAPFKAAGPIELRVLVENYKYQVVCPADFARDRAYLVAEALMKDPELSQADRSGPSGRYGGPRQHPDTSRCAGVPRRASRWTRSDVCPSVGVRRASLPNRRRMSDIGQSDAAQSAEHARLAQAPAGRPGEWKAIGPYVSERAWGTVREDYSANGMPWEYFPHDHARSRAYRWSEDGLAGICDIEQRMCFALAFWNGRDPILKERIFGLGGNEGNHSEDAKEYWWYVDATPTASWLRWRYHYPQAEFPYARLREENAKRGKADREFELVDTGVFDGNRYWQITADYAKAAPRDVCLRIRIRNAGPEAAELHVLPTLWFRNRWSWDAGSPKPGIRAAAKRRGRRSQRDRRGGTPRPLAAGCGPGSCRPRARAAVLRERNQRRAPLRRRARRHRTPRTASTTTLSAVRRRSIQRSAARSWRVGIESPSRPATPSSCGSVWCGTTPTNRSTSAWLRADARRP